MEKLNIALDKELRIIENGGNLSPSIFPTGDRLSFGEYKLLSDKGFIDSGVPTITRRGLEMCGINIETEDLSCGFNALCEKHQGDIEIVAKQHEAHQSIKAKVMDAVLYGQSQPYMANLYTDNNGRKNIADRVLSIEVKGVGEFAVVGKGYVIPMKDYVEQLSQSLNGRPIHHIYSPISLEQKNELDNKLMYFISNNSKVLGKDYSNNKHIDKPTESDLLNENHKAKAPIRNFLQEKASPMFHKATDLTNNEIKEENIPSTPKVNVNHLKYADDLLNSDNASPFYAPGDLDEINENIKKLNKDTDEIDH